MTGLFIFNGAGRCIEPVSIAPGERRHDAHEEARLVVVRTSVSTFMAPLASVPVNFAKIVKLPAV